MVRIVFCVLIVLLVIACDKDEAELHGFDIDSAGCVLDFNAPACPDSNFFEVVIKGSAFGTVGTILTVSVANTTVDLDCGSWELIEESDFFKYCLRGVDQPRETTFDFTGSLDCIPSNAFFGRLSYNVNTTDSGTPFGFGLFGDDTGSVFCGL